MTQATIIRQGETEFGTVRFWRAGEDVLRTTGTVPGFDTYGRPMGARWECSIEQFERFASIYDWCPPVAAA